MLPIVKKQLMLTVDLFLIFAWVAAWIYAILDRMAL